MKLKEAVKLVKLHQTTPIKHPKKCRKKSEKFFKKYGFHFEECWSLDHSIACFVLPRLIQLKKVGATYPNGLTFEEWQDILDKMIDGFAIIVREEYILNKEKTDMAQEAIDLFAKYYFALWD